MFGIGGFELFLILLFGFLIFGPDKLPEIAKTLGKAIAKFRGAQESMSEQLKGVTFVDKESSEPLKNPIDVLSSTTKKAGDAASNVKSQVDDVLAGSTETGQPSGEVRREEGFAERKARYDRERAARKQAEREAAAAKAAEEAKKAAEAAEAKENPKLDIDKKKLVEEGD